MNTNIEDHACDFPLILLYSAVGVLAENPVEFPVNALQYAFNDVPPCAQPKHLALLYKYIPRYVPYANHASLRLGRGFVGDTLYKH